MKSIGSLILTGGLVAAGLSSAAAQDAPTPAEKQARAQSSVVQQAEPAVTRPAAPTPKQPAGQRSAKTAPGDKSAKAMDRLELEASQITGNRELPKVMVVVPWKRSDIGDFVGRPLNSLVDEALQPVDREVFRREIDYYGALSPDHARVETRVTGAAPAERPEK
jgi:hypothetical protein